MQFDLIDLRLFVRDAEECNLTRAAFRQHLSLAAASARIKALEAQTGLPLFYREARLTPPGEAFLHHAPGVLRQAEQLRADLQEYSGGLRGHVPVFANTTEVTDFLPEILPGFCRPTRASTSTFRKNRTRRLRAAWSGARRHRHRRRPGRHA